MKWNWRNLAVFLISEGKVVCWQQDLEFNAQTLCNLVSRCFSLFDMKYLFCRVLPYVSSQKLRGNGIGIPFLTPRTRENNEKLKLSTTNKTHIYSLLVTFDVLRVYIVTEKSKFLCAIFCILIHSDSKILQSLSHSPLR